MKETLITIAMPVYNSGIYLDESIGSLLSQTFSNFELYCMNDASTDGYTIDKLNKFSLKDNRIKTIHQKENHGPGFECNLVIDMAKGDYFIRLDSDDIYDSDMLEKMVTQIRKFDADVCVSGMRLFSNNSNKMVEEWLPMELPNETGIISSFKLTDIGKDNALSYSASSACNKLVRTDLLRSSGIRFAEYRYYEDAIYADRVSLHANRIVYANARKPLMSYRRDVCGQLTDNPNTKEMLRYVSDLWLSEQDKNDEAKMRMLQHRFMRRFLKGINSITDVTLKKEFYTIGQNFARERMPENYLIKTNPKHSLFLQGLIELSFESGWYIDENVYITQLYLNINKLELIFSGSKKIVILGNGKRSDALQKILKRYNKEDVLVTDQNPEVIKAGKTKEGYNLVAIDKIQDDKVLIASNHDIYQAVADESIVSLIDLEAYCPIN